MTDLKVQYESIKDEINIAMQQVINESGFILGKQVDIFERNIANYLRVKFAVGVASGTDALVLSLCALNIGNGDEVITTPFTFIATAEAISRVGAKPVFCDIDYDTYNIDANKIEDKITLKTKAILPVHLYGLPSDMTKIMAVARKHNLKVIEDCAQSFGSECDGKKVGSIGDCGCLSFFPAKTLGCFGDGGMVVTNSEDIVNKIRILRNHGSNIQYHYSVHGFNSRLDTLQATILDIKLKYIDKWISQRIENAVYYNKALGSTFGIIPPKTPKELKHTFNYYTLRVQQKRDALQDKLRNRNIPARIYYPLCLHLQEVYRNSKYKLGDFPVAEQTQLEVLSLPMYPELTQAQLKEVVDAVTN